MNNGILEGIKVVDLSRYISGPNACSLLGNLGADVIKVESPDGEPVREYEPALNGESFYYMVFNRNKRGVTLNTRTDKGKELLRALLADRDICVQRPLVLLMGGANDIFFSGTDTGARANMGAMLNQLLSLGVHTMIGIPTPICAENAPPAWAAVVDFRSAERQLEQYCAWLRRFSKCFGAECIDFRADFFDPNGRLKRELLLDGLHPTPEGHQIMARRLCAHLKRERQG